MRNIVKTKHKMNGLIICVGVVAFILGYFFGKDSDNNNNKTMMRL